MFVKTAQTVRDKKLETAWAFFTNEGGKMVVGIVYGVIALAVVIIGVMIFRQAAKEGAK